VLTSPSFGAKLRYRRLILSLSRSAMAHHPVPDRLKPDSPTTGESETQPCDLPTPAAEAKFDSNLTDLAARFVTQSGGCLSPEVSAELALEIVLNEIVEQACLATRATGAAIVLRDESEMVCRASSGETAPALGVRFDIASGLSGLCIETSHVQRCDDAQTDLRADVEACRRLGVRSVMVLPLLGDAEVVGLFEIFSSRPSAFSDRDEHTLEALSRRVLKNLELAAEPLPESVEVPRIVYPSVDDSPADSEPGHELLPSFMPSVAPSLVEETSETPSGYRFDLVTGVLGAAVLACVVLLVVLIDQRLGGRNAGRNSMTGPGQVSRSVSGDARGAQTRIPDATPKAEVGTNDVSAPGASTGGHSVPASIRRRDTPAQPGTSASPLSKNSSLSEGGLRVYENGKEIFRMSSNVGQGELPPNTGESAVRQASAIEPARILELSPTAAEGGLLHRVEPEYPEEARKKQLQGPVVLDVRISRDGEVQNVNVVSGQRLLADAAIAAVKLWRFNPRRVNGQPTEMQTTVTLNFRLPPS
jgi:TonB family protein